MSVNATVAKRRLLKLVKVLKELPRSRFDFGTWVGTDWRGKKDLSCGTTGCALGWATTIPTLRKAGLRLMKYEGGGYVALIRDGEEIEISERAAADVFGITYAEAYYLFNGLIAPPSEFSSELDDSPDRNATPKQVAKHIKRFVKVKFPND